MSHCHTCPQGFLVVNGAGLGQLVHIDCQCTLVYGISGKASHFVPCHACYWGFWWSMVLAWDNWSTLSANIHWYKASQARRPTLSHVMPPYRGFLVVNGAGLGQLVHIVCQWTLVHGISGKMSHILPCHAPL